MATQGFQLSQFDRAPDIPSNVGVVDTKSIYGAVVDALRTNEALRTTQLAQAKTDAELGLARDKALTEQSLLEPEAVSRRARANLLASESAFAMPGVEGAARARRAQDALASMRDELVIGNLPLASQLDQATLNQRLLQTQAITPEMVDAQARASLMANRLAAGTAQQGLDLLDTRTQLERLELERKKKGAEILSDPALIRQMAQAKAYSGMPAALSTYGFAQRILADPNSTPEQIRAAQIMLKTAPTANADPTLRAQQSFQAKRGSVAAALEMSLPKLEGALESFQAKSNNFDRLIDEAEALVSPYTTGFGSLLDQMPASQARALATTVMSLEATLGFDALQEMRANSPTGGALGNVTDFENKRLSATIASLDTGVDGATFLERLQVLRNERAEALRRMRAGLMRDQNSVQEFRSSVGMQPSPLAPQTSPLAPQRGSQSFNYKGFTVEILPPTP
jgi:hypothetical protein